MFEHRARLVLADWQRWRTPGFRYNLGSKAREKCVAFCPSDVEHRRFQMLELGVFVDAAAWFKEELLEILGLLHNRRRRMVESWSRVKGSSFFRLDLERHHA